MGEFHFMSQGRSCSQANTCRPIEFSVALLGRIGSKLMDFTCKATDKDKELMNRRERRS